MQLMVIAVSHSNEDQEHHQQNQAKPYNKSKVAQQDIQ